MEQKNHGSPSFINIAVLLFFAIVIGIASTTTTYYFLNSKTTEQYADSQSSVAPPQTYINPTVAPIGSTMQTAIDNWKMKSTDLLSFKYPPYWEENIPEEGGGILIQSIDQNNKAWIIISESVYSSDSPDNPNKIAMQSAGDHTVIMRKEIMIDGHKAIYQELRYPENTSYYPNDVRIEVFIGSVKDMALCNSKQDCKGSYIYDGIHSVHMDIDNLNQVEVNKKILDQILSTFKYSR